MIDTLCMYDVDNYKDSNNAIIELNKKGLLSDTQTALLHSALRNQCMIITGTDLGYRMSSEDYFVTGAVMHTIHAYKKAFKDRLDRILEEVTNEVLDNKIGDNVI